MNPNLQLAGMTLLWLGALNIGWDWSYSIVRKFNKPYVRTLGRDTRDTLPYVQMSFDWVLLLQTVRTELQGTTWCRYWLTVRKVPGSVECFPYLRKGVTWVIPESSYGLLYFQTVEYDHCLALHCVVDTRDRWEFPPFFRHRILSYLILW